MSAHTWRAGLGKDARALLPMWAACLAALAGAYVEPHGVTPRFAAAAYIVGPGLLGAHVMGHEYSHRTLPMLLAQPIDRRRIFLTKIATAAVMALTIAVLASVVLARPGDGMWQRSGVRILPLAGGVLMAPWIAMICRSSLAGVLFTGSIFATALIVPAVGVSAWLGTSLDAAQALVVGPWSIAMIVFSVVAGVIGLRSFSRLEAGEGSARSFALPRFGGERPRRFRPLLALAGKELQLQHLTLTLAGLAVVLAIGLAGLQRVIPSWADTPVGYVVGLYCVLLSLVIGALASAEERQLGVLEWQLVQPASALTQWAIKAAVAIGLSVLLAAALPAVLTRLTVNEPSRGLFQVLLLPTIFLTAAGLFLSSLTNSGAWALVLTLPAGVGSLLLLRAANGLMPGTATPAALRLLAAVAIPLLLWLGFLNHRSVRTGPGV